MRIGISDCCGNYLAIIALLGSGTPPPPLWGPMSMKQHGPAFLIKAILSLLLVQGSLSAAQSVKPPEAAAEKINRALSAGPPSITGDATVTEIGARRKNDNPASRDKRLYLYAGRPQWRRHACDVCRQSRDAME
jgi:hypothetical protein